MVCRSEDWTSTSIVFKIPDRDLVAEVSLRDCITRNCLYKTVGTLALHGWISGVRIAP